jgi:hypothetical protein
MQVIIYQSNCNEETTKFWLITYSGEVLNPVFAMFPHNEYKQNTSLLATNVSTNF